MVATVTSSNIRARAKVMWSEGEWQESRSRGFNSLLVPTSGASQRPLTCAWQGWGQLGLRRGDAGHMGAFHVSQAVIVPKGTMEVFIRSQGGKAGDRQGDLGHMEWKEAGGWSELVAGCGKQGACRGRGVRGRGSGLGRRHGMRCAGALPEPAPGEGGGLATDSGRAGSGCPPRSSTATGWAAQLVCTGLSGYTCQVTMWVSGSLGDH